MSVLSPIMSFIVDKEVGFPIPSEKEKVNKALKRYRQIYKEHPNRSDIGEIMFGIADLLVGRNDPGDYAEATKTYDQILLKNPPEYLKARALIGKAELLIGTPAEFANAITLCEKARQILGKDLSDFFSAKSFVIEAELLLARREKGDWAKAVELINQIIKEKNAHWYFRGRALLSKAEILFYREPGDLGTAIKLSDQAIRELKSRPDDYFSCKGKILRGEMLIRREKRGDFEKAEKILSEVLKSKFNYSDLIARAKLDLADIVSNPKAGKLLQEVSEMEGLDPYLAEKAKLVSEHIKERPRRK
ncbi:MAG: hypothetical protein WCV91_00015 [Candidatus Margulisiibacteriota bacterium]